MAAGAVTHWRQDAEWYTSVLIGVCPGNPKRPHTVAAPYEAHYFTVKRKGEGTVLEGQLQN